ncbi:Uncharacterized protein FWK35_00030480 [Aphis craccivora]|uniref:Uncharacterized protein n=1 Tax=Aphis craccivora TaxID=307492 RepID=A0A6G0VK69_APHCR|nr:Uncharacterized protein FWK35_00030480 [Aphis craccivora]
MNLVGAFDRSFFEFPNSFQKRREKPKKNLGKTGIFMQNQPHSIFYEICRKRENLQRNDNDLSSNYKSFGFPLHN